MNKSLYQRTMMLGCLFMFFAALSYSLMSLFVKITGDRASVATLVFVRFFISLLTILPFAINRRKEIFHIKVAKKMILRSVVSFVLIFFFFYSLRFLPLADALLYSNTSPLFVPIVAWIMIKVRTPPTLWFGIVLGFIGIGLVLHLNEKIFSPAALLALTAGILIAVVFVMIRIISKSVNSLQILFYTFLYCTVLSGLVLPFYFKTFNWHTAFLLLAMGIFGSLYQVLLTLSLAKVAVRITSSLMFLCIVFGALADYFIWHHVPDLQNIIGMALVIIGGIITIYLGHKSGIGHIR